MFSTKNKTKIYKELLSSFNLPKKRHKYADIHLDNIKCINNDMELDLDRLWNVSELALKLTQSGKDIVQIHKSDLEVLRKSAWVRLSVGEVVRNCIQNEIELNK